MNKCQKFMLLGLAIIGQAFSQPIMANSIQSLDALTETAERYALNQAAIQANLDDIDIVIGNLDPRLRLVPCASELIAFTPPGSRALGNTTVGIRCDNPKPWSIYIPVKVSIYSPAVVVINSIRRGEIISSGDISLKRVDISLVRDKPFKKIEKVIGSKAKNTLNSGVILSMNSVCVVCKGDSVSITASNTAISVKMAGLALSDGSIGDSIRVQNSASKRIIDAVVVSQNTVKAGI